MKTQNKMFGTSGAKPNLKKYTMFLSVFLFQIAFIFSQSQAYDNFEGNKSVHYGARGGILDTLAKNPASNNIDSTKKCAKYVRSSAKKYDNIKMAFTGKLTDVSAYATYIGNPPKISMKVYTTAPVGTLIEIQLGKQGAIDYPAGTNSQYQAHTTVSNAWEEVQFKFSEIPKGSETHADQVDQLTLLFNPNSSTSHIYYFDDLTGPPVLSDKSESSDKLINISTKKVNNSAKGVR